MKVFWQRTGLVLLAGALAVGAASCRKTQKFQVRGVVEEVLPERGKVRIAHETIPDYMEAMTMMFDVKDTNELTGLQSGDAVSFRMVVTDDDGWIEQVRKIVSGSPAVVATPAPTFREVKEVEPLTVGDALPEYRLTNELGQVVRTTDFRGRALAFTFIFTRCPFPTFCPRMSSRFADAQDRLRKLPGSPTNWHLLTITFDPQYDTPAVLKAYAQQQQADPRHWSFATGDLTDITALGEQFGLLFWRPDPAQPAGISHNLRTVVVDARGRVRKILVENEWTVDELVAEIVKAASAP
jgi:protein SCO1/2